MLPCDNLFTVYSLYVWSSIHFIEQIKISNLTLFLVYLTQGSDADKSDDNLVVDEVSMQPLAYVGLTSLPSSAYIM